MVPPETWCGCSSQPPAVEAAVAESLDEYGAHKLTIARIRRFLRTGGVGTVGISCRATTCRTTLERLPTVQ